VSSLLIGFLGALMASNQPAALSNLLVQSSGISIPVPNPNDSVEKEYQKLLADDDDAQAEVDKWIKENQEFAAKGAGLPPQQLKRRILDRFEPVRQAYEDFLKRHPDHARAHIAYGSFLGDLLDDEGMQQQWEKALELDPKNPAIYDDLAGIYAHTGPVKKAFEFYAKAAELNPREPLYYRNWATVVYLFRTDAKEYYNLTEQEVFDKAMKLYGQAMKLAPDDFLLASDVAESYYGIKPMRLYDALNAWTNALHLARDDVEREGVNLHLARVKLHAGLLTEARAHLESVTNEMYTVLKNRLARNLIEAEAAAATNHAATTPVPAPAKPDTPESSPGKLTSP